MLVTRETVQIAHTMATLHGLEVKAADVSNAYMMASNREKIWTVLDPEFRDNAGKSAVIVRVLYSLKSACASLKAYLAQCMQDLGYQSCDADPDLLIKAEYRLEDNL